MVRSLMIGGITYSSKHVVCVLIKRFKLELKYCRACVRKIQYEGVCREANTTRGKAECCICLETPPECCIFHTHKQGGVLSVILYFLVVWLRAIFSSTQTAVIFGDQDISKCLTNLFIVVEQTNMINLASFSDLQCHAYDQSCCLSIVESCLKSFVIRRSVSVYTIYS